MKWTGPKRILVLGTPAAGKSRLTARLTSVLGLPRVELDSMFFSPCWQPAESTEWTDTLARLVRSESWIIDGNHLNHLASRLERAEFAIVLDFSPVRSALGYLYRAAIYKFGPEQSVPPHVIALDGSRRAWIHPGDFILSILRYRSRVVPTILAELTETGVPYVVLRTPRSAKRYVSSLLERQMHSSDDL